MNFNIFTESEYPNIATVMSARKDTYGWYEDVRSSDRSEGVVPNMTHMPNHGGTDLWTTFDPDDYDALIDTTKVQSFAEDLATNNEHFMYIDLSSLPLYHDTENGRNFFIDLDLRDKNARTIGEISNVIHARNSNVRFGFRNLFPGYAYEGLADKDVEKIKIWQEYNKYNTLAASTVDFLLPLVTTPENDFDRWEKFAKSSLLEARRYGKPTYAIISGILDDGGSTAISSGNWRTILELCLRYADGIQIYLPSAINWATAQAQPWWAETQDFIAEVNAS